MGGDEVIWGGGIHQCGVQADGSHRKDEGHDQQHTCIKRILFALKQKLLEL